MWSWIFNNPPPPSPTAHVCKPTPGAVPACDLTKLPHRLSIFVRIKKRKVTWHHSCYSPFAGRPTWFSFGRIAQPFSRPLLWESSGGLSLAACGHARKLAATITLRYWAHTHRWTNARTHARTHARTLPELIGRDRALALASFEQFAVGHMTWNEPMGHGWKCWNSLEKFPVVLFYATYFTRVLTGKRRL